MRTNNVPSKKVVLFLVEGITDRISLGLIISKLIETATVHFAIARGDICCKNGVTPDNSIKEVFKYVTDFMNKNYFKKNDILKIVHLIDTDGAFVPVKSVKEVATVDTKYFDDRIETSFFSQTIQRISNKKAIVGKLVSIDSIAGIDYSIYYFSRNIEHVLHNISKDLSSRVKGKLADEFEDLYANEPKKFIDFINSSDFAVGGTYAQTWEYIMQNNNSLNRNSNFHLFFCE